jgi:hypothetical protein
MNTNLLNIVKQITAGYGEGILADPARLKAFFSDLAKDEPKPLRIAFGRCVEAGAYAALKNAPDAAERAERKTVIAQRLRDEHGLDPALCAEALDILEAALFVDRKEPPRCAKCGAELGEGWKACPYCGAAADVKQPEAPVAASDDTPFQPLSTAPVHTVLGNTAAPVTAKTHTVRNVLIVAEAIAVVVILAAVVITTERRRQTELAAERAAAERERIVELDEYDHIIFSQKKNNDVVLTENLLLKPKDVKAAQEFIKDNFPDFKNENIGNIDDDYELASFINEFNNNPASVHIYLSGIEKMAGMSSVYANLFIIDDELLYYDFRIDHEFSDSSGLEYGNFFTPTGFFDDDNRIDSITLNKYLYADTNEPYWEIVWFDEIPNKERLNCLKYFLTILRGKKVFQNLDFDFLRDMYTGIEDYQTIGDIVDWYN